MSAVLLAALAAAAEPGPFGENGQYEWICQAQIDRSDTLLKGYWSVSADFSGPGQVEWQSRIPIQIDDYRQKSSLMQSGWFSMTDGTNALERATLRFTWQAPRNIPKAMILTYGAYAQTGGFVSLLVREKGQIASGTVKLGPLMRWAGTNEKFMVSIATATDSLVPKDFLGAGWIVTSVYRQLELDNRQLQLQLTAKAADFQNQCARVEHDNEIMI